MELHKTTIILNHHYQTLQQLYKQKLLHNQLQQIKQKVHQIYLKIQVKQTQIQQNQILPVQIMHHHSLLLIHQIQMYNHLKLLNKLI
jgi:hypothetical protein